MHLIAQVVRSPEGDGKGMLAKPFHSEILKKKKRFLYVVDNGSDNQLCFAINLALLLYPHIINSEATAHGRNIQNRVRLSDQTAVKFNNIPKSERAINRKFFVFSGQTINKFSKFVTQSLIKTKKKYAVYVSV